MSPTAVLTILLAISEPSDTLQRRLQWLLTPLLDLSSRIKDELAYTQHLEQARRGLLDVTH